MLNLVTCVGFMLFGTAYAAVQAVKLVVRIFMFACREVLPW